jgi:dihydroorotase
MADTFDLVISGGVAVLPSETVQADIGIRDGRIAEVGEIDIRRGADVFVATGLHILPGVIDTQVHFREPGLEHKEDLQTGSRAAVLGGVTAVFEMPNTKPPTVSAEALEDKLARAKGRMFCDYAFFVGGTAENAGQVASLEGLPGCAGIKVFMGSSTGSLLVDEDAALRAIVSRITRRASFHCEDEARLNKRKGLRVEGHPESHPIWRDEEAALIATRKLVELARELDKPIHVLHVSTAEEMALLREAKRGSRVSVEVTPHHLTLEAPDAYERLGTRVQMNPPVRDSRHREALWQAIADGTVDILGSDHAPHTAEEKAQPYPASPSGMTGVQTLVPVMLNHVHDGRLSLERFVELSSTAPARLFNMPDRGAIAPGMRADFTVVDLKSSREITDGWIASKSQWTPYHGVRVTGWPLATILAGRVVMLDGAVLTDAAGAPVTFGDHGGTGDALSSV